MDSSFSHSPAPAKPSRFEWRLVGALGLALVIHVLALGLLSVLVDLHEPGPSAEIQAVIQTETRAPAVKVTKPITSDAPAQPPPFQTMDFSIHGTVTLPSPQVTVSPMMRMGEAKQVFSGGGGMGVPMAMRSRGSVENRLKLLTEKGGSPLAEDSVQRALQWLARTQNDDGSWGKSFPVAMTGYAVLCFLGHGDTPESATYGREVSRGVKFLTETSAKNRGLMESKSNSSSGCYEHGIATYALGEVYAMARFGQKDLGPVVDAFDKGVQIILQSQTEAGGWLYHYKPGPKGDMSVTGWQYQALKAARQTRLSFPTLEKQIQRTERFLLGMRGPRGGFGYDAPGDRATLNGVGVLGLQMFNPQEHRVAIVEGLQLVLDSYARKRWSVADVYSWYYNTQATFNFGGAAWDRWNAIFQSELLKNQQPDGHWRNGSANKARFDADLYCTVLCTLMLEVYYRYQPVTTR